MANSKIYLGSTNIGSLFQGVDDISIYLGENKVYPLGEPTFKWKATYSDSSVTSAECDSSSAITKNEINKTNLVSVEIGDCVNTIGEDVLSLCLNLTSINIPNSVTSIAAGAFRSCNSLTSVAIPDSVTSIGDNAFWSCTGLTSCTIGSGVTSIGNNAFYLCGSLTSITVNAITPPTLSNSIVFNGSTCPIYVPCESVEAYKSASGWSTYASRITCPPFEGKWKATYQDSHTESAQCDSSSEIVRNEINLTNLVSVEIGDCVTSIGSSAFQNCTGLTSIEISDSVTSIGNRTFNNCTSFTSVTIPDSVTSIGNNAFADCDSLAYVVIGSGVTSINEGAFANNGRLFGVACLATTPPTLGTQCFRGAPSPFAIYVPSASVETYKTASGWSEYASRIKAIP